MDIYYDSEFIDDGERITPLSIGFHREDDEELYRIMGDPGVISRAVMNPWLRENVLSSFPIKIMPGPLDGWNWEWDPNHPDMQYVTRNKDKIRQDVQNFLLEAVEREGPITLWAWYAAYDHVLLAQLFGRMLDLPPGIPMFTCDLKQEHVRLGEPELPRQALGVHNALADARHNRVIRQTLLNELR